MFWSQRGDHLIWVKSFPLCNNVPRYTIALAFKWHHSINSWCHFEKRSCPPITAPVGLLITEVPTILSGSTCIAPPTRRMSWLQQSCCTSTFILNLLEWLHHELLKRHGYCGYWNWSNMPDQQQKYINTIPRNTSKKIPLTSSTSVEWRKPTKI